LCCSSPELRIIPTRRSSDLNKIKDNTQWRVLTVGIGAEHYEARAVRIGDWTGTRREIADFFDEVCNFIEVNLALGACVYRDERRSEEHTSELQSREKLGCRL